MIDAQREGESVRSDELLCPRCQTAVLKRRPSGTICDACGYVESCEDNFVRPPTASLHRADVTSQPS